MDGTSLLQHQTSVSVSNRVCAAQKHCVAEFLASNKWMKYTHTQTHTQSCRHIQYINNSNTLPRIGFLLSCQKASQNRLFEHLVHSFCVRGDFISINKTHLHTSNPPIACPPHRMSTMVTMILLFSRGQRALKTRRRMGSVRVQQRRRQMKEDRARKREMKRHMIPQWPKSDLQRGWTAEEIATHQSKPTRGMWGTVTGQQGREAAM